MPFGQRPASYGWVGPINGAFHWQGGYGDFSLGWSQLEELVRYIQTQEQHHRRRTFQEEYRDLLRKYHVEYDERSIWD